MTTISEIELECCICAEKSNHMDIGSTSTFGTPDLDTRPPEMQRSTICHWIQRCPFCGYCSSDISESSGTAKEFVESKEYQSILKNKAIPQLASSFLAESYEKEQNSQYSDSAWRAIHAAWICDDEGNVEGSKSCRVQAISMIEQANLHSQQIANQDGASEAITIDLMRRAGLFQQALKLAENIKEKDIEGIIMQVVEYEVALIQSKDIDSHTISEAIGEGTIQEASDDG